MRSEVCAACGRRISLSRGWLRKHRVVARPANPPKGWKAAPWCPGPLRQAELPL